MLRVIVEQLPRPAFPVARPVIEAKFFAAGNVAARAKPHMLVLPCLHYRFWNLELIRSMELILCVV